MQFNKQIAIENKVISEAHPTFVIAEAGVNHGGDMKIATQLIDLAAKAGADAVKFQTFKAEHLILDNVEKAPYQQKTTDSGESQYNMLKRLEVSREQNLELKAYCKQKGIIFLTTPFDEVSLDELDELDLPAYKVASTDTTNIPFLRNLAKKGKPIFLSTGMTYLSEVKLALETIYEFNKDVVLLQCTANYPIGDHEANLKVIDTYKANFDVLLGYSDHTVGVGAAPFAIPMGAKVVEKHFTLDKSSEGPDHRASLDPEELIEFVQLVRKVDAFMGSEDKKPNISEVKTRASLQKCLVAKKDIKAGETFSEDNLIAKRTGGIGISPIYYHDVLGNKATKDFGKDSIIEL
ncbi:MAG: N-acetylneuraminate synthase [Flavobacteriales bacterium]|nr:N-acetylneuraminate synthase [Flavobacteriales bacterium]